MSVDSKRQGIVSRILNFSCVDGPGNRLVIFLQGCNFNCITCHNPHTINHCDHCGDCVATCPTNALFVDHHKKVIWESSLCTQCDQCLEACPRNSSPKITQYSVADMVELIRKQHLFLGGITVSGGESTLQLPFIIELFKAIKLDSELSHLSCFVDSNGYLSTSGWQRVLPYLDGAMIDLKSWQNETHQWLVGRDNHRVIQSIRFLAAQAKLYELRLLHIPGKSDLDEQVDALVALIHSLPDNVIIRLNAFQHHGVVGQALNWDKCGESQIEDFHQMLRAKILNTIALPSVYL